MDASRFTDSRDEFPILDFVAAFEAKSDTSVSFMLGRHGDMLKLDDMDEPDYWGQGVVFTVFGWADVHHPCHGHIKARLRVLLTDDLMTFDKQREIINSLFDALAIPRDETYEADFFSSTCQQAIEQPVDRDGYSDRM